MCGYSVTNYLDNGTICSTYLEGDEFCYCCSTFSISCESVINECAMNNLVLDYAYHQNLTTQVLLYVVQNRLSHHCILDYGRLIYNEQLKCWDIKN